jgi:tetratricopeptide (TPR) repeat protein
MRKPAVLLLFVFQLISNIYAQEAISPALVEQKSLELYTQKKWSELIPFGNQALAEGNDYFYLRMRLGIAYYELQNYTKAEIHFNKALTFNSADEIAKEYLYYSYLFNAKYDDARALSFGFSNRLNEKIGAKTNNGVVMFFMEGGTKLSDSAFYYNKSTNSKSNYFNPAVYLQAGLTHYVSKYVTLTHALTYFNQSAYIGTISQFQYYINAGISLKNNWSINPTLHWVNLGNTTQITTPPPPVFPPQPPRTQTIKTVNNYFVASVELEKRLNNFRLSIGSTVSNMNDLTQIIHTGGISVAPLGNQKLLLGLSAYFHTTTNYATINTALTPFISFDPIKQLSIKMSYLTNQNDNFIEQNGYIINNSPDLTTARFSVLATGRINKHLQVYGLYQSEQKQEVVQKFNYQYSIFVGGFKIIF